MLGIFGTFFNVCVTNSIKIPTRKCDFDLNSPLHEKSPYWEFAKRLTWSRSHRSMSWVDFRCRTLPCVDFPCVDPTHTSVFVVNSFTNEIKQATRHVTDRAGRESPVWLLINRATDASTISAQKIFRINIYGKLCRFGMLIQYYHVHISWSLRLDAFIVNPAFRALQPSFITHRVIAHKWDTWVPKTFVRDMKCEDENIFSWTWIMKTRPGTEILRTVRARMQWSVTATAWLLMMRSI